MSQPCSPPTDRVRPRQSAWFKDQGWLREEEVGWILAMKARSGVLACRGPNLAQDRWGHLTSHHKMVTFPTHSIQPVSPRNASVQVFSLSHLAFASPIEAEAAWGCV